MYEIEDNVPVPPAVAIKYPLRQLEVGQSFFVPCARSSAVSAPIANVQKSTGRKFVRRKVDGGFRVWRVE